MLRGGYITICYVPNAEITGERQLVGHRVKHVRKKARFKNLVHVILLQNAIRIKSVSFSQDINSSYMH